MKSGVEAEFTVAAASVLHPRVTADDHAGLPVPFSPRTRPSRAFKRPWSASIHFACCSVSWNSGDIRSSITARNVHEWSVKTSTGSPRAFSKNARHA